MVGRISGVYGLCGWVRVFSYTSPRRNILGYSPWYLKTGGQWYARELIEGRVHGKGIVARLEGCADRDQALALMHSEIGVRRAQLPQTGPGEYYWADLVGLRVETRDGTPLGVVDTLFETGANDVVVVKGERERLIPYQWGQVITAVDLDHQVMVVDWDPDF